MLFTGLYCDLVFRAMTQEEVVLQYNLAAPLVVEEAGRMGRGVFSTEPIKKGTFLCEYRTGRIYHPQKRANYYVKNGEGSSLLETQFGRRLVFDATRVYDQLGRYINHSSIGPNCNYWGPLFVRGKYRVEFVALRDMPELTYDYGIRNQSWMTAVSPKKAVHKNTHQRHTAAFVSAQFLVVKKLSNHLTALHPGITKLERTT